jgi:hypothetical protein
MAAKVKRLGLETPILYFTFIRICVTPLGWVLGGEEEDPREIY